MGMGKGIAMAMGTAATTTTDMATDMRTPVSTIMLTGQTLQTSTPMPAAPSTPPSNALSTAT